MLDIAGYDVLAETSVISPVTRNYEVIGTIKGRCFTSKATIEDCIISFEGNEILSFSTKRYLSSRSEVVKRNHLLEEAILEGE